MDYENFVIELIKRLNEDEKLGLGEASVKFYANGLTADGNELLLKFIREANLRYHNLESDVLKGNYINIEIPEGNGITSYSRFDADYLYKLFNENGWDAVTDQIYESAEASKKINEGGVLNNMGNYNAIKDHLIIRPINYTNSRNILKEYIYQQTGDIALVLYAVISGDGSPQLNTTKIPKSIFEEWGKPLEEVWDAAMNNTMVLAPPRLYHSFIDVAHPTYEKGIFMTEDGDNKPLTSRLNMVTTTKQVNGAIALFYPGVLEKLSELAGGSFYVSFTSMHEAHIHPYGSMRHSAIQQTLLDTNRHFPGDMLTQKVFFYDAKRKIFYAK